MESTNSGEWLGIAKNSNGNDENTIGKLCQTSWQLWNTLKPKEGKVQMANYSGEWLGEAGSTAVHLLGDAQVANLEA